MCCLICCFKCWAYCGCRERLLLSYAFFPPIPDRYDFILPKNSNISLSSLPEKGNIKSPKNSLMIYTLVLLDKEQKPKSLANPLDSIEYSGHKYLTHAGAPACGIFFRPTLARADYIVIFSHGNSTDIGRMHDFFIDFARALRVNVFAYEYTGYGHLRHSNPPSDLLILDDIHAAYLYVMKQLNFPWNKIILYGQSVGSGPSIYLASNINFPVGGLILHSPISSGLRMLDFNMKKAPYNDLFPNVELIRCVQAPTFIIHGSNDEEVPVEHGKIIRDNAKNLFDFWVAQGCGHNDIDLKQPLEYFQKITVFLKGLDKIQRTKKPDSFLNSFKATAWPDDFKHLYRRVFEKHKPEIPALEIKKSNDSEDKKKSGSSQKSSSKNLSSGGDNTEKKHHSSSSFKSKSHSFVEFSSRNSSAAMVNPKVPLPPKTPQHNFVQEVSQEMEEEEKKT